MPEGRGLDKNWLVYKDPYGSERNNRSTKMDPTLVNLIARKGVERGYGARFPVALAGAESTFGRQDAENPMQYKNKIPTDLANSSSEMARVLETTSFLEQQGMPKDKAKGLENYLYKRYVLPAQTINKAFDTLDKKAKTLKRLKRPITPENLAWLYQGSGTINAEEVPSRRAYGKPVTKNTPSSPEPVMVRQMMAELKKQKDEGTIGNYLRKGFSYQEPSWYRD